MPNCLAAVSEATTVPSPSTTTTLSPAFPLAVVKAKVARRLVVLRHAGVNHHHRAPVTVAVRSVGRRRRRSGR